MLKNKDTVAGEVVLPVHGFLVAIEVEKGTDIDKIGNTLADTLMMIEGVGGLEVNHLGEIEVMSADQMGDDFPTLIKES